jgi:hypothetical protein
MEYISHVEQSIDNANNRKSKLILPLLQIEGMSGEATRHFYNNICSMSGAKYLEIGTWKGSTVCSAMYGNSANIVCIDNWSEFGGPKNEFKNYFNMYKGNNFALFYETDCFKIDIEQLPKFNIFMYDGEHSFESHYKALPYYLNCLESTFIFIVDDWNWDNPRLATLKAINDLGLKVLYKKEIFTDVNEPATPRLYNGGCDRRPWANGCGIFILEKPTSTN